jgi:hypothetical protein
MYTRLIWFEPGGGQVEENETTTERYSGQEIVEEREMFVTKKGLVRAQGM